MSYPPSEHQPDPYGAPYGAPAGGPPPARVGCARRVGGVVLIVVGVLLLAGSLLNKMTTLVMPGPRGAGMMIGFFISIALSVLLVWLGIRLQRARRR